jgi:adenylate cyclase
MEIERKFLVPEPPPDLAGYRSSQIRQGYLAVDVDGTEVRVRTRGADATLTVKRGRGEVREEEEVELEPDEFGPLWRMTEGRRVEKRRHLIPAGEGLTIELDVYEGELAGLVVAEVEFPGEDQAAGWQPPEWFGPEVTGDPRFSNQRLAVGGRPS